MFNVSIQNLFGAGLLLTLAFSVNDRSAAPDRLEAQAKVQSACEDRGSLPETPNSQKDTGLCSEIDFR